MMMEPLAPPAAWKSMPPDRQAALNIYFPRLPSKGLAKFNKVV
jgi:hypothetical protein